MQGSGVTVVELMEAADVLKAIGVDQVRKAFGLLLHFSVQILQEALHVDPPAGQSQYVCATGKVNRNRVGDGAADTAVHMRSELGEVQQGEVAAHAEPRQGDIPVVLAQGVGNNNMKVFGSPAVIKTGLVIHGAAAGTEIPGNNIPAFKHQRPGQTQHIRTTAVPFQAVGNDGEAVTALSVPVQMQFVIIRGWQYPGMRFGHGNPAEQAWPDRLHMAVA